MVSTFQFVHVKSRHPNAMPLIMTHGWPGSIFELLKVVGPLTDPTAFGGRAEDAVGLKRNPRAIEIDRPASRSGCSPPSAMTRGGRRESCPAPFERLRYLRIGG
jgi:hypothetical protein